MIHLLQQGPTTHIYLSSGNEANHQDAAEINFTNDPTMSVTNFYGMGQLSNGVVLKVFRADAPNAHSKAMTEIDTLRRLQESSTISRCPSVIALYFVRESSSTPPSLPILGLEHCARGDLLTLCYDQDFIFEDVPFFAAELVLALDHLRKHNVLHGDIKPENIGVTGDGHLRLLDFKSAKVLGDQSAVVHEAGTLAYTSPEVLTRVPCTRAADWWSLGVVLFELFFRRPAFLEKTEEETMNRIMLYALRFLRRQFAFGEDDLPLPSCLGLVARLLLVTTLAASVLAVRGLDASSAGLPACTSDEDGVEKVADLKTLAYVLGAVLLVTTLVLLLVFFHSLRGTIIDAEDRALVSPLLRAVFVLVAIEGVIALVGISPSFRVAPEGCDGVPDSDMRLAFVAIRAAVCTVWIMSVFFFTCGFLTVSNKRVHYSYHQASRPLRGLHGVGESSRDRLADDADLEDQGAYYVDVEHATDSDGMSMSVTRLDWERRCRRWCKCFQILTCNIFGSSYHEATDETYRDVANVMARFFKGMDVVPSDLIAALCLLRAEQRSKEKAAVNAIVASESSGRIARDELERELTQNQDLEHEQSVHDWLWSAKNINYKARTLLRVQHISESRLAVDAEARSMLAEANHFAPYMLAIYGKLLYTYMNIVTGPCQLLCGEPCRNCLSLAAIKTSRSSGGGSGDGDLNRPALRARSFSHNMLDDDCCSLNYSALLRSTAGSRKPVFVFASFGNRPHFLPYSIGVDEESQTVVLAVRGTLSASDMLVDAVVIPKSLQSTAQRWGFTDLIRTESYAHSGMLLTAENLRKDIEDRGILHALLLGATSPNASYGSFEQEAEGEERPSAAFNVDRFADLPDCRGYKLKVVGHSLGAGVASILSLMLKDAFPGLSCLAYSPPGCVFDYELACRSEAWISSIFVGSDLIPHSSWRSLMRLRAQMMEMLRRSKVNKTKAIRSAFLDTPAQDLLYPEDGVPDTFARRQLALRIEQLRKQAEGSDFLNRTPMFCPGKLLHVMRIDTFKDGTCSSHDEFLPVWVRDRRSLHEFDLSSSTRMALDHFPDVSASIIDRVAKEFASLDDRFQGFHV
ncbi:Sn1-specific diacylglycerol lipase alpha [Hondaea fermentalgiana]|uniref:sn-1-specific diacylglycerol lipase n=1 Tax=Hondaea fermentalgiana TaxID=2315210 RepID=A0A2R5GGE6_9STRA|nr:Sn1-specific diacylglycerol lipase alpha [Hondaea fermentalgiana]|eukprot:GBG29982.1 Sn1-specific diacylglycerol lipase alpha [Hondaea fermentalgiana]